MPAKKEWTDAHEKRLSQLTSYIKNYVKPDIGEDWLLKYNKRMLMTKIKNNTSWADSTKMNIYFTIARYLEINKPEDTFIDQFKQKGWDLKQQIEKIEGQNKLDAKEELYYRDYSYFVEILKSISYNELATKTEH